MKQVLDKHIVIYTIGHGNRRIEEFVSLLHQNDIDILIDVRSLPYSRFHSQFRQINLKASLEEAGITYLWLGRELGGRPSDPALYNNGKANYQAIKETLLFKSGIDQVLQLPRENIKVTLMCSESDQNQCHRKTLIAEELISIGLSIIHINKTGKLEEHINVMSQNLFT